MLSLSNRYVIDSKSQPTVPTGINSPTSPYAPAKDVSAPPVGVFVSAPSESGAQKMLTVDTAPGESVGLFKQKLALKAGLDPGDLVVYCNSKPLSCDGAAIGEYGLRAGATLHAHGRLRGGGDFDTYSVTVPAGMTGGGSSR